MSETQKIGTGVCPVCTSNKAQFTVTKKQLVCMTCNACNCQIFSRSDRSDELLRARIKAAPVQPDTSEPVREKPPITLPVGYTVTAVHVNGEPVPAKPAPATRNRESLMSW